MQRQQHAKKVFSENLRHALERAHMTQTTLAKRTLLSRDAISTYVNERSLPSSESLKKIARVLKVSPMALLPDRRAADRNVLLVTHDARGGLLEARIRLPMDVMQEAVKLLQPFVDK